MKNVPLLRKVRDQIAERPWEWEQGSWVSDLEPTLRWKQSRLARLKTGISTKLGLTSKKLEAAIQANDFTCETAFCAAGWAAYFAGATPIKFRPGDEVGYQRPLFRPATMLGPDGQVVEVRRFATSQLGLTTAEASVLFHGANGYRKVLSLLDGHIAAGEQEMMAD